MMLDGRAEVAVGNHRHLMSPIAQRQSQSEEWIDIAARTDCHEYEPHIASAALFYEHGIAIAEKAVALLDGNTVQPTLLVEPNHSRHQSDQG